MIFTQSQYMPVPSMAWTPFDSTHTLSYYDKDIMDSTQATAVFLRELGRFL